MEIVEITRSKLRKELLRHFFLRPRERFYLRELERILGRSVANIRRELKKLEAIGLFTSQKVGNLTYYFLNKKCPLYHEIRSIVLKTAAFGDIIRDNLKETKGIKYAFVYGSFAKGEEIPSSDIDLMVIGDVNRGELTSKLYKMEKAIGRQVNLLTYSLKEVASRIKKKNAFMMNVLKGKKIMIIGDEHELQRTGKG
jgi:predicted nucleotidyltransferase